MVRYRQLRPLVTALLVCFVAPVSSCGTDRQPAEPETTTVKRIAEPYRPVESPKVAIAGPHTLETTPPEIAVETKKPTSLMLPVDEDFFRSPLPTPKSNRYSGWRPQGRIQVGQTHLSKAALIDGDRILLAMSEAEATVRVYERTSRKLLANLSIPGLERFGRGDLAPWPSAGGEPLFLLARGDGLWLMSASNGEAVALLDPAPLWNLRWSPDRRVLVAGASDITTQTSELFFFLRTGARELTRAAVMRFPERVDSWDLSRDNRLLAVIYYPSDTVELIDLRTLMPLWRVPTPEYSGDVAISPDGRAVAVGGAGLLLVDAREPAQRTVYTRFGNNVGRVRFSPSGDAVVTSSYDGKVRIFGYDLSTPSIELLKTLSHSGTANVYELLFVDGGDGLISTSGDKTIRYWGLKSKNEKQKTKERDQSPLLGVKTIEAAAYQEVLEIDFTKPAAEVEGDRRALLAALKATPRHRPAALDGPPRSSRIKPGRYACRVSDGYKLRDCLVEKDAAGHTMLEVGEGNLIQMRGVLWDDGPVVRFEGWPTEERPFGCFACQERCFIEPETCGCRPRSPEQIAGCLRQPLHAVFKGEGDTWRGVLLYRGYYDDKIPVEPPPATVELEEGIDRYTVFLKRQGSFHD